MRPELLDKLDGAAGVFKGTPHGDFLVELVAAIREDEGRTHDHSVLPLSVDDVRRLEHNADEATTGDVAELCDSHEALRLMWRSLQTAIVNHEFSITEGVRDPTEVDRELWASK